MKRLIRIVFCIVTVATPAWAGPYEDGVTAYDQGRFDAAYVLWKPLAEQGNSAAQFNLGVLFEKGLGVAQDYAEAARWYMKAGERGDEEAQYNVALMYEKGTGLSRDLDKARYWYDKVLANTPADRESLATKRALGNDWRICLRPRKSSRTKAGDSSFAARCQEIVLSPFRALWIEMRVSNLMT